MYIQLGQILHGTYEILDRLGEGGFAITYTARMNTPDRPLNTPDRPPCVVKEIPFPISNDPRVLERARGGLKGKLALCTVSGKTRAFPNCSIALKKTTIFI
jgi:hypothetical protein